MNTRLVSAALTLFVISIPFVGWAFEAGVALTPAHVLGLALAGMAGVTWLRERPALPRDLAVASSAGFLLVAAMTVVRVQLEPDFGSFGEAAHAKSIKQLIGLCFGVTVFAGMYCITRWYGLGVTAARVHYWTTSIFAALALLQYAVALVDMTSPLANFPVHNTTMGGQRPLSLMYGFPRVSLTMVEPSMLAVYLLTGWAFWLFTVGEPGVASDRRRRLFLLSGCVLGASIVVTGSRLAYMMVGLLVIGAVAFRPHRAWRVGLVAAGVIPGVLMTGPGHAVGLVNTLIPSTTESTAIASAPVVLTTREPVAATPAETAAPAGVRTPEVQRASTFEAVLLRLQRAAIGRDESVQQRVASYIVAGRVSSQHPWLGTGLGTSAFYMERLWPSEFAPPGELSTAAPTMMSQYATVLAETGLVGFACLALFTAAVFVRLTRLAACGKAERNLAWGAAAALVAYYLSALATAFVSYQMLLVWVLLAIALTIRSESPCREAPLDG